MGKRLLVKAVAHQLPNFSFTTLGCIRNNLDLGRVDIEAVGIVVVSWTFSENPVPSKAYLYCRDMLQVTVQLRTT